MTDTKREYPEGTSRRSFLSKSPAVGAGVVGAGALGSPMMTPLSKRTFYRLIALLGIIGTVMIGASFGVNPGPQPGATNAQLIAFGRAHFDSILWGAWLQAVGPLLIILFAYSIVQLSGATQRLSGIMTFFGGAVLMMVSLTEVVFYISALYTTPATMTIVSNNIAHAVQHLYFIVAAPSLFVPLGIVILTSSILPRFLGYLALLLGTTFAILGLISLYSLYLPSSVTALAAIQAFWWVAAAIALIRRSKHITN